MLGRLRTSALGLCADVLSYPLCSAEGQRSTYQLHVAPPMMAESSCALLTGIYMLPPQAGAPATPFCQLGRLKKREAGSPL